MARLGHSTPAAALRYQHAAEERDQVIANALSKLVTSKVVPIKKSKRKADPGAAQSPDEPPTARPRAGRSAARKDATRQERPSRPASARRGRSGRREPLDLDTVRLEHGAEPESGEYSPTDAEQSRPTEIHLTSPTAPPGPTGDTTSGKAGQTSRTRTPPTNHQEQYSRVPIPNDHSIGRWIQDKTL
jgi:hypothetical protein